MNPAELEQNSLEWLTWRRSRLGASDSPIILGVSPWKTRYELWLEKTMRDEKKTSDTSSRPNAAIERGNRFESAVRALHELETGLDFPPAILVHPQYDFIMCSLDGYAKEEGIVAEYKVAGEEVFKLAQKGIVHEKYYPQVQHQLMVTGAKENHFYVGIAKQQGTGEWHIADTAKVIVKPDLEYQKGLLLQLVSFWDFVQKDIPPPLTDRDTVYPDDQSTLLLFSKLKKLKDLMKSADCQNFNLIESKYKEVKQETIEHVEAEIKHPRVSAAGVSMSKGKRGWVVRVD